VPLRGAPTMKIGSFHRSNMLIAQDVRLEPVIVLQVGAGGGSVTSDKAGAAMPRSADSSFFLFI